MIHQVWLFESNTTLAVFELLDNENLPHEAPGAPKIFRFERLNIFILSCFMDPLLLALTVTPLF